VIGLPALSQWQRQALHEAMTLFSELAIQRSPLVATPVQCCWRLFVVFLNSAVFQKLYAARFPTTQLPTQALPS
jgi:hypothetical protein